MNDILELVTAADIYRSYLEGHINKEISIIQ